MSTKSSSNVCCHYCRISRNRKRKKVVPYVTCNFCQNTFCANCVVNHLLLNFEQTLTDPTWKCKPCQDACCCCKSDCKEPHRHCFTYTRTLKRYKIAAGWNRKKLMGHKEDKYGSIYLNNQYTVNEYSPIHLPNNNSQRHSWCEDKTPEKRKKTYELEDERKKDSIDDVEYVHSDYIPMMPQNSTTLDRKYLYNHGHSSNTPFIHLINPQQQSSPLTYHWSSQMTFNIPESHTNLSNNNA